MGLSVWRETSKKLTVYRVCYTPIETLILICMRILPFFDFCFTSLKRPSLEETIPQKTRVFLRLFVVFFLQVIMNIKRFSSDSYRENEILKKLNVPFVFIIFVVLFFHSTLLLLLQCILDSLDLQMSFSWIDVIKMSIIWIDIIKMSFIWIDNIALDTPSKRKGSWRSTTHNSRKTREEKEFSYCR